MDAADGAGDPGQPPLHGAAGVEPAAHRIDLVTGNRAGSAGAAVEPARELGHLQAPATRRWSGRPIHRRPGMGARRGPARAGRRRTCWPGCWRADVRAAPGISWSNGKPAYLCRHGHTSATRPDAARPANTYVREEQILSHLAALAILDWPMARQMTPAPTCRSQRPPTPQTSSNSCERQAPSSPTTRTRTPSAQRRQRLDRRHHRPGLLTAPERREKGDRITKPRTPAAAGGRARVAIPHARKTRLMGI